MQNPGFLIDTFLIIFIGMGPIKALLIYISLTKDAAPDLKRKVAKKAVVTATVVGLLLLVAGAIFMQILHFTTSALTIAGGLILLLLALNMVLAPAHKPEPDVAPDEDTVLSKAIYPLGIPLLLNPVGIVALTVLSSQTEGDWLMGGVVALMVLIVAAIDYGIFSVSDRLGKYLTYERILVLEKLLGILLAALAVQMILNGLAELGIITMSGGH
jgi:multiple antibiotic resistance protein